MATRLFTKFPLISGSDEEVQYEESFLRVNFHAVWPMEYS